MPPCERALPETTLAQFNLDTCVFPSGTANAGGLTKRELYAALILAARTSNGIKGELWSDLADEAVHAADALLERLSSRISR